MKNLLFAWIIKPIYLLSILDIIIFFIEISVILPFIIIFIDNIIEVTFIIISKFIKKWGVLNGRKTWRKFKWDIWYKYRS